MKPESNQLARSACRSRLAVASAALLLLCLTACEPSAPPTGGGPATIRRLTQEQYRESIAAIFSPDVKVNAGFEPDLRDGLVAVGTSQATVSRAGFEQYYGAARDIAAEVVSEKLRGDIVRCQPASQMAPDDACAGEFLGRIGRRILRRPVAGEELQAQVALARSITEAKSDFYAGLAFALSGWLTAPEFLFRVESAAVRTGRPEVGELDAFSKANRLSFFLWNGPPDDELLDAAERGDLDRKDGLEGQIDRLLASPRLEKGVRAFFADYLNFDKFSTLQKDLVIYPAFRLSAVLDSREQALRMAADHLLTRQRDYRDLFTTRDTFLSRPLGMLYRVPVATATGWEPYAIPKDDPRAGILGLPAFLALYSHAGRSSSTLRGKAVREIFLCQVVADPPPNVDFKIVQETTNPVFKTARERLTAHREEPTCAGCHKVIDPIGLALENFDGAAQFRETENDVVIDASGEMDGDKFAGLPGLGKKLSRDPAVTACLVDNLYRYAVGRPPVTGEAEWLDYLHGRFAADGYQLPRLLKRIATSEAFFAISSPATPSAGAHESSP